MPRKKCGWTGCGTWIVKGTYCSRHSKLAWKRRNPDKVKAAKATYRARTKGVPTEPILRTTVYNNSKGVCGICGKKVSRFHFHIDHIIPVSKGGPNTYGNVQAAHPSCNQRKGARV